MDSTATGTGGAASLEWSLGGRQGLCRFIVLGNSGRAPCYSERYCLGAPQHLWERHHHVWQTWASHLVGIFEAINFLGQVSLAMEPMLKSQRMALTSAVSYATYPLEISITMTY